MKRPVLSATLTVLPPELTLARGLAVALVLLAFARSASALADDPRNDRSARADRALSARKGVVPNDAAVGYQPLLVGTELLSDGGFEVGSAPSGAFTFSPVSSAWTWQYSGTAGTINRRYWSSPPTPAHTGSWCLFFNTGPSTDRLYQTVAIPSGVTATLSFWLKVGTFEILPQVFDTLKVSLTDLSGSVQAQSATYSNLDDVGYVWVNHTYDISAFAGKTVRLQFDSFEDSTNDTLFLLDDVSITASSSGSGSCSEDAYTMCLVNGRYRVTSHWQNQYAGNATANLWKAKLTDTTGAFWIADANTYEYLIRFQPGQSNGRTWIAVPTFTDVEFWIDVTDTVGGQSKEYHSLPGNRTLIFDPSYFVYP